MRIDAVTEAVQKPLGLTAALAFLTILGIAVGWGIAWGYMSGDIERLELEIKRVEVQAGAEIQRIEVQADASAKRLEERLSRFEAQGLGSRLDVMGERLTWLQAAISEVQARQRETNDTLREIRKPERP